MNLEPRCGIEPRGLYLGHQECVSLTLQLLLIRTGSQPDSLGKETGAENETRTRGLLHGKQMLYQLSYLRSVLLKRGAGNETRTRDLLHGKQTL